MTTHKFHLGARVQYRPPQRHVAQTTGEYVVARLLPPDGEGNQYRIENRADGQQRVVHEAELSRSTSVF